MTLRDRCDHVMALIDEVLGDSARPTGDARPQDGTGADRTDRSSSNPDR